MGMFDARDYSYEVKPLLNGSSKEMDVNGSGTAQVFSYTPSTGEVVYIDKLTMLLQDPGSMDVQDFGAIGGGLSNGLLIEYKSVDTTITFANLEDNGDIATTFTSFWSPDDDSFLDDEDTIVATYTFPKPIELEDGDFFRATVRDNLNGISWLRISIMVRKVLD